MHITIFTFLCLFINSLIQQISSIYSMADKALELWTITIVACGASWHTDCSIICLWFAEFLSWKPCLLNSLFCLSIFSVHRALYILAFQFGSFLSGHIYATWNLIQTKPFLILQTDRLFPPCFAQLVLSFRMPFLSSPKLLARSTTALPLRSTWNVHFWGECFPICQKYGCFFLSVVS